MRYANLALEEKRRRGELNPEIIISNPGGSMVVTPKGISSDSQIKPASTSTKSTVEAARRESLAHATWVVPTPRELTAVMKVVR